MACCDDHNSTTADRADPASHVNFTKGMVLGVDDYRQEHAYLAGQIRWLARETLGYGVTSGLAVAVEPGGEGPVVRVTGGSALLPSGRLVCVTGDQCARLNAWLAVAANAAMVEQALTMSSSPPASPPDAARIPIYIVLSYRECQTAPVPIPGEPCRSEDELMAPSRITDDYQLELLTMPPPMREHEVAASFAAFLGAVVVDGGSPPPSDAAAWMSALEDWAASVLPDLASPPHSPPLASPPGPLTVAAADWPAFEAQALRFWTSQIRPKVMARHCNCGCEADDDRLLLARLDVPVIHAGSPPADQWQVDSAGGGVSVDESVRATLPSLQLGALIRAATRTANN